MGWYTNLRSCVGCAKTVMTAGRERDFRSITSATLTCCRQPCPTRTCLALVTHYEPRIQSCLISANVKTTQQALAFLTKLQSLENLSEQHRSTRREFECQDQTRRTPRDQPMDRARNRRPNGNVQVRYVRRGERDMNLRGNSLRDPHTNQRRSFCGQGRPGDGAELPLNATAQDFVPCGTMRRSESRSPNMKHDWVRGSDLNA